MRTIYTGSLTLTIVIIAGLFTGVGLWYAGEILLGGATPIQQTGTSTPALTNNASDGSSSSNDLIYAVKEGKDVTVYRRDGFDGEDTELISYVERVEADKSGNLWAGLPPSIALSHDGTSMMYTTAEGVFIRNLATGDSRSVISKVAEPSADDLLERPTWSVDTGSGAYGFAVPRWSSDDRFIGLLTVDWEGSTLVIRDASGDGFSAQGAVGGNVDYQWSPTGNQFVLPTYGGYSRPGLYVGSGVDTIAADIMEATDGGNAEYYEAQFSIDGGMIVFTQTPSLESNVQRVGVVSPEGTNVEFLTDEGVFSSPFFGATDADVYFVRNTSEGVYMLQMYNRETDTAADVMLLPSGYDQWQYLGWENEFVLMQGTISHVGVEAGDGTQLYLLDPASGAVIEQTGPFEKFVTFVGLVA